MHVCGQDGLEVLHCRDHSVEFFNDLFPEEEYLRTTLQQFLNAVKFSNVIETSVVARDAYTYFMRYCQELDADLLGMNFQTIEQLAINLSN